MDLEEPSEIYVKKVILGNKDIVRQRLMDAVESLGYDIVEDEPHIVARRGAKGWGTVSANILDVPMTLTLRLKAVSENSTGATFDYLIKHNFFLEGDKRVILQEARTIAAISKAQAIEKLCSICETESTDDSKFCRKCGAPLTSEQAELEVLRMMSETRAAKASISVSSLMTPISAIVIILAFILNNADLINPKLFAVLLVFGGLSFLFGIVLSFFGWGRLKEALNRPATESAHIPRHIPESLETGEFRELPPRTSVPASVTEGTTNLLDEKAPERREKERVPVGKRRTTKNLE
ncbi:MAG: hypothetical protein OEM82_05315 [Acidobacteriota bacterium]|nr:hypothetical protein [Acidobacteriota bacterium]MDH3528527.1 hypothetical protein [Acidobacteriota bacterium]